MAINERLIDTEAAAAAAVDTDNNLILHLDASDVDSYDGDGDEWIDIKDHEYKPTTNVAQNFNTVTYDGNRPSTQPITGVGFQPDLVWIKNRDSGSYPHVLTDSVRGNTKYLHSSSNDSELTTTSGITAFGLDGFSVGANGYFNGGASGANDKMVAWCFKAGGAPSGSDTVSIDGTSYADEAAAGLTAGTIAVDGLSANNDLGFSIVKWSATTTGADTTGHGLGSKPELVIMKKTSDTSNWFVYTDLIDGSLDYLLLNTTAGKANSTLSVPTSSVFTQGNLGGMSANDSCIAYCFASKRGVSKVGSYKGTGASGNKVYTGFEPAFIMTKRSSTSGDNWNIIDNVRDTDTDKNAYLKANEDDAETDSGSSIIFNRDGFTLDGGSFNTSNQTHIYYAVAKNTNETSLIAGTNLELHLDAASFPEKGETGYDNTPSTWTDSTSNSNDGTITGATFDSELGNYLDFDGTNDFVDLSGYGLNSSCKSFEVWFNADSWTGLPLQIGDDQNAESFLFLFNGNLDVRLGNSQARYTGFNTTGSWIHVVATPDSSNRTQLYVNGDLINTSTDTIQAVTQNTAFLGKRDSNNYYFNGKIGQVRVYDATLTQDQIRQNYNFTKPNYPNGYDGALGTGTTKPTWNPAGYFNFDGGSDYVDLTGQAPFSSSTAQTTNKIKSITGWIKPDTLTARVFPYTVSSSSTHENYFQIGWFNDLSIFRLNMRNGSTATSRNRQFSITPTTDWVHFVVQVTDTTTEMYINGQSQTVIFTPSAGSYDDWITYPSYATTVKHTIGISRWSTKAYSDGNISKIKMYDKALTQSEVTALHSEGR